MQRRTDSVSRYRAAYAERDLVAEIESLMARTWPPLTLLDVDGWQLRSSGGLTVRANSVWPRADGARLTLDERLDQAASFYRQGGLPPAVQVSPSARPAGLGAALVERGYRRAVAAEVRTRRVDRLVGGSKGPARLVDRDAWLEAWVRAAAASDHDTAMAARILGRVSAPSSFAVVGSGAHVAVARGVLDGGWLGIDLLAATSPLRHATVGTALLTALARWAVALGAERAYCEVGDPVASTLTTDSGLRAAYRLRYLVQG